MRHIVWVFALAVVLSACPKEKASPALNSGSTKSAAAASGKAASSGVAAKKPGAKKPGAKLAVAPKAGVQTGAGASKTSPTFTLAVVAPKETKVGAELPARITLKPHGEYHVNMLYPFQVTVEGPADSSPKQTVMHKKDAKTFTKEGVVLVYKTKVAKAGEYKFSALVKFSVCTESHCEVKKETLVWSAKVQ